MKFSQKADFTAKSQILVNKINYFALKYSSLGEIMIILGTIRLIFMNDVPQARGGSANNGFEPIP